MPPSRSPLAASVPPGAIRFTTSTTVATLALLAALAACGHDDHRILDADLAGTVPTVIRREPAAGPPRLLELVPGVVTLDAFLADRGGLYRLRSDDDLRPIGESRGPGGVTYSRLQQYYRGLPVIGNQVIVANADGFVHTATGRFTPDLDLAVEPTLSAGDAVRVVADVAATQFRALATQPRVGVEAVSLAIVADGRGGWRLAYAVELPFPEVQTFWAQVDAATGELLQLDDGRHDVAGTVDHTYEGPQVPISVSPDPAGFLLATDDGLVYTRNANNHNTPPALATDVTSPTTAFPPSWSADAHYAAGLTMTFLDSRFARKGWDGAGTRLPVFANVQWNNAGFIKPQGQLEIGNVSPGGPTDWASLDIIGHEIGHGVTYSTVVPAGSPPGTGGGLIYQGESGALDESFADTLGTLVEFYAREGHPTPGNWRIGEDVFPPDGIRNMLSPVLNNQPEAYGDPLWKPTAVGSFDSGGVHSNSGVGNKWFSLLADDDVALGTPSVNSFGTTYHVHPLGKFAAGLVSYVSLFNLASGSQYVDARTATLAAATQVCSQPGQNTPVPLIDTQAYASVWEAWRAVAVGAASDLAPAGWTAPAADAMSVNPVDATLEFTADWDPSDTYTIELDIAPSFAAPQIFGAGPGDTYLDVNSGLTRVKVKLPDGTLAGNKQYWWRVRNDDVVFLPAELSAACTRAPQTFTTGDWQIVLSAPLGPDQHPWKLKFDWQTFAGIAKYELELYNTDDANQAPEWTATVVAPPYELDVRMFRDYYWRVRPISSSDEAGLWTALAKFSTVTPLGELSSPANNSSQYPWGVPLKWAPVVGADVYRLELTDYPECFPPGVQITTKLVKVPGDTATYAASFQPTWNGMHQHCWRVTPVGPELFAGKYKAEDGAVSDPRKIVTQDHATVPGSVAPLDRVTAPAFWNARAPYLLYPSTVGAKDVAFAWSAVPQAQEYRVEYFPIRGFVYGPADLHVLVGATPYAAVAPATAGQPPPTTLSLSPYSMTSAFFANNSSYLYGFWYRIVAIGPDGYHSPSPAWTGVTAGGLFPNDDTLFVPPQYALLAQQPVSDNTGVVLVRPPGVKLVESGVTGNLWYSQVGDWPEWFGVGTAAIEGTFLWAPWQGYAASTWIGAGCAGAPASMAPPDDEGACLPTKFRFHAAAPALTMGVEVRNSYGDGVSDPATYWATSPYAGSPEAAPFAVASACDVITLPEPDNYAGTDGAVPGVPPAGPPVAQCDAQVHAGGNAAETHIVELGQTSGTTTFFINTYQVPDALVVKYQGAPIAASGCFGTAFTQNACNINGWCCGGGVCGVDLTYGGASSQMTVEVDPNCSGSGETEWQFSLTCP